MKGGLQSIVLCVVVGMVTPSIVYGLDTTSSADKRINLRILYAGHPGSTREQDFVTFLKKHFKGVDTGDLKTFKETQTTAFDVIILDYDGDGFKAPHPRLSNNYSRPTVTMGVAGALICSQMGLKTGYI